jgi:hypothetical protein
MKKASVSEPKGLSAEEKAERLLRAIRPMVARAIEANNVRRGAKMSNIEANSAAVGDVLARALMEAGVLDFGRATDEEVAEARGEALKKADAEVAAKFRPKDLRVVRQMRERTLRTKRGPVRCSREYLYFPDLAVGLFPPRHTA